MKDILFLDTETTGIDPLIDRLFQVCYKIGDRIENEFFKPSVPISIKAQSISHVTNKMVEDKSEFRYSEMKKELDSLLKDNILVAHSAPFDIDMIEKEGVSVPRYICTLKIARFLDPEGAIPEYNLQYLRYYFGLEIDATAHDAKGDVLVLEAIFKKFYNDMLVTYGTHDAVLAKMMEVSLLPSLFQVFPFGKHRGKRIEEAVMMDRTYVEWLLEKKIQNEELDEDWIFTLKHHLNVR